MKLVVLSGRSGAGKSTALQALEDAGFYCIDNLPATLLPELIEQIRTNPDHPQKIATCIDARNLFQNLQRFPDILRELKARDGLECELIYMDAAESALLKRYSATRRKHPLSGERQTLVESIQYEGELLEPLTHQADLRLETSQLNLYDLRDTIHKRVAHRAEQSLSLQFQSFGFKNGVPLDVDFTFDVRMLPNPYWIPELRKFNGRERPIIDFLQASDDAQAMITDITAFLENWLPRLQTSNRSYVTVGIGCTGGHHRSVYISEALAGHFRKAMDNVHLRHRELT